MIFCYIPTPIIAIQGTHFVTFVTSTPTPPLSISVSTSPDYVMDTLTAVYVALTLTIAIVAIWSVRVGRKQSQTVVTPENWTPGKVQARRYTRTKKGVRDDTTTNIYSRVQDAGRARPGEWSA